MPFLRRDSDELEAALALGGGQRGSIGEFADALRHAYVQAPGADVAERHLRAMHAAAAPGGAIALEGQSRPRTRTRPRTLALRVALFIVSLPLLFAGLAVAGVNLPEPAQNVFEGLGIHLPNQESSAPAPAVTPPAAEPQSDAGIDAGRANACAPDCGPPATDSAHAKRQEQRDPVDVMRFGHVAAAQPDAVPGTVPGEDEDGGKNDGGTAPPTVGDPPDSVDGPALPGIHPPDLGLGDKKHAGQDGKDSGSALPDVKGTIDGVLDGLTGG